MDFGQATLLAATLFALIELTKLVLPDLSKRQLAVAIIVWCQLVPRGVAHSDWGAKQIIDGLRLDSMNEFSLAIVGVALAGLAAIAYKLVAGIPNIGELLPSSKTERRP